MIDIIVWGIVVALFTALLWAIALNIRDNLRKAANMPPVPKPTTGKPARWEQEVWEIVEATWDEDDMDRIERNAW